MFLGIVSSNGLVGPTIWVPLGVKINAKAYQDILHQQVKPGSGSKTVPRRTGPHNVANAEKRWLALLEKRGVPAFFTRLCSP